MKVILEEYLQAIAAAAERIERCEAGMRELLEQWRLAPAVRALMAMKGFQTVAAMILVSELGEVHRFTHPRQVMAYLGLVPTENTSSDKRRQGHITKCGNAHARWLLVECAQHYATPPKVSQHLSRRQEGQPREVRAISWRAQNRLHHRYTKLLGRRLQRNKAIVAIARELSGFIWELLRTQSCYQRKIHFCLKRVIRGGTASGSQPRRRTARLRQRINPPNNMEAALRRQVNGSQSTMSR